MSEIQNHGLRIVLSDGSVIENGRCGYSDGHLWCWLAGYTMPQAAQIFFDPGKTAIIVYEYGEMMDRYEGFTTCTTLMVDGDGVVSVCLIKGVA